MNKLFKNAMKSFLQSKVAMILLAFIVLISSATFTMLNSASISFQTSYQKVMNEGNVHDFTVKEKWKLNGKVHLAVQEDTKQQVFKPALNKNTTLGNDFTNGKKILYIPSLDKNLFDLPKQKIKTPSFKLDLSEAILSYPNNGTKLNISGKIKIALLIDWMGNTKQVATGIKTQSDWTPFFEITNKTTQGKIFNFSTAIGSLTIKSNKSGADILDSFSKTLDNEFKKTRYHVYTLDSSKSTGIFQTTKFHFSSLTKIHYPFLSTEPNAQAFSAIPNISKELKKIEANMISIVEKQMSDNYVQQSPTLKLKNNKTISEYIYKPVVVKSLFVASKQNQYKVVSSRFAEDDVDKTVLFSGQKPSMPYTEAEMQQGIDARWKKPTNPLFGALGGKAVQDKTKNFHWTKTSLMSGSPIDSVGFTNFESLQAVVSSSYVFEHNLTSMSQSDLKYFRTQYLNGTSKKTLFQKYKSENKVVTIDSTDYLISGVGTSPDFAFPIINQKNPLPNAKTQAIIFTTELGYNRIQDAFRNNETENYLAYKFKPGTPKNIKTKILQILRNDAQSKMSWPKSISPLTMKNDINERVILAPQRISFLKNIQQSIATISYLTTSMLSVLMLFIIAMVIKKQINSKRKILSILLANGYTKNKIAISMMSIAFIIIIIPAMLGYVSGYFLQLLFISIFNNYWTLPLVFNNFSFITMSLVIGLPMIVTMLVAYLSTRAELKGDLLSVMKQSSSKTGGWITTKINSKLTFIKAKGKITISLFTSNLSKMFMVFITSTMAIIAGSVAFSILGKFDYAKKQSAAPINYSFKVDLETPTASTNTYSTSTIKNFGLPKNKEWSNTINPDDMFQDVKTASQTGLPYFHWVKDPLQEKGYSQEVNYLKHKIQIRALLDMNQTAFGVSANPWSIAKASMPDNQLNQSDKQDEAFLMSAYKNISNYSNLNWFTKLPLANKTKLRIELEKVKKQQWFQNIKTHHTLANTSMSKEFKNFIFFSLKTEIMNRLYGIENHLPFMISYGNIVRDVDDELYSQLSVNYSNLAKSTSVSARIIGIKEDSKMVSLDKKNINALKKFKMQDISTPDQEGDAIPIIINSYFQEAYKVKTGDTISLNIQNHKDKNDSTKRHSTKAKIVGIQETYNGIKIYSLQKFVNNKLGYDPIVNPNIFNGVFTKKEQDPLIFSGVNLYADSDFYIGSASISQGDAVWAKMEKIIKGPNWTNNSVTDFSSYVSAYSQTPYVLSMSNANWAAMSAYAFNNTLDLTNKMIWMIEIIAILIALFFISIIALMVVDNNKTFIATTKVLGYTKREIKGMFFRSIIIPLVFATAIAAPITYAALIGIKFIIMSFGAILIPLSIIWWSIPAALLILIVLFSIIYRITMSKFGNQQILEAFKA